jgi:tryptophan-specific transport protein
LLAGLCFALGLALVVWFGTGLVGRASVILVAGMVVTFLLSVADLSPTVELAILLDNNPAYAPFLLAAMPYYLTSFGYHSNVPSLVKYYGKNPAVIVGCLFYGSLTTLVVYLLWLFASLGNIPRDQFTSIFSAGGNIGDLVAALSDGAGDARLSNLLGAFANFAVVSSFLGVTLGLFDFIADKFSFDDSHFGRFKTALVTFLPPTLGGLLFPDGFVYAIGLAGLSAVVWGIVVPALCAKVSREKFGNPLYRVWGGNILLYVMFTYGAVLVICYVLAACGVLPVLS